MLSVLAEKLNRTYPVQARMFFGDEITVVFPDATASTIFRRGYLNEGLTRMVMDYLGWGDVFIDAGANIGYYTLLASTIVGDYGSVHSFEPTPNTFRILESNCIKRKNIFLNKCALFSEETTLTFNDYGEKYSTRNSFVIARFSDKRALQQVVPQRIVVSVITIDKYVKQRKIVPNFIKIDVESAEYFVLKGMQQTIEDSNPIITIEVGDMGIQGIPSSRACLQYLIDRGYRAYEYKDGRIIEHRLREQYSYDDILLLPKCIHN